MDLKNISAKDYYKFGCPKCGAKQSDNEKQKTFSELVICTNCREKFLVLARKANEPFFAIGNEEPDSEIQPLEAEKSEIIAISDSDFCEYGCPVCGDKYARFVDKHAPEFASSYVECNNCNKRFIVLKDGSKQSLITVNGQRPKLSKHPLGKVRRKNK